MNIVIGIGILLVAIIGLAGFIFSRIRIASPTEALIVSGAGGTNGAKVVKPGGRVFVMPVIQKLDAVSLEAQSIPLGLRGVDKNKVSVEISGVAVVKVRSDDSGIRDALERFGSDKKHMRATVQEILQDVFIGALRSAIAEMQIVDLLSNREVLAQKVRDSAIPEATKLGLQIDSLQISDISDNQGFIKALGEPEIAKVQADARIAQANQNNLARQAEIASEEEIANRERAFQLKQASIKQDTDKANAEAEAAGPLARAEQQALIAKEEQKVASENAVLRALQLETEIQKPADAEAYRVRVQAEADRDARKSAFEAEAYEISQKGEAEAYAVKQKGEAEAYSMKQKAEAYEQYNQAAVLEMTMNTLPLVARELAAPMSQIDNLTVLSTEGAGALPKTVANNFGQLDEIFKTFTGGHSLSDLTSNFAQAIPSVSEDKKEAE